MNIQIKERILKLFNWMSSESTGFFNLYASILGRVGDKKSPEKNKFLKKHENKAFYQRSVNF